MTVFKMGERVRVRAVKAVGAFAGRVGTVVEIRRTLAGGLRRLSGEARRGPARGPRRQGRRLLRGERTGARGEEEGQGRLTPSPKPTGRGRPRFPAIHPGRTAPWSAITRATRPRCPNRIPIPNVLERAGAAVYFHHRGPRNHAMPTVARCVLCDRLADLPLWHRTVAGADRQRRGHHLRRALCLDCEERTRPAEDQAERLSASRVKQQGRLIP